MRTILLTITCALAASCGAGGYLAPRLEAGAFRFEEGGLGDQAVGGLGLSFQDDLLTGAAPTGWVGDVSLRASPVDEDLGGARLTGLRTDLDAGTRFYPASGSAVYRPFFGFGGTLQLDHLRDGGAGSASVCKPGVYGELGVEFAIGRAILGVRYRHTAGVDARLGDDEDDTNLDGGAVLLTLGVSL